MNALRRAAMLALSLSLGACGWAHRGLSDAGSVDSGTEDAGQVDAGVLDAGQGFDLDAGLAAAALAATTDSHCTTLGDFVWELGDQHGRLAGGAIGTTYLSSTTMELASATKWLFGAYVVERFKQNLSAIDLQALTMRSGYVSFAYATCTVLNSPTVSACFKALSNDKFTSGEVDHFHYNGGHFQKYAVDLGLGDKTNATLAAEFIAVLGAELPIAFDTPQLAGGAVMSLDGYAVFLRKVMSGDLAIHEHLGEHATCTLPSACPSAIESPSPLAWDYSYGHWVEDEPQTGDGAFSSAGAYGFYPWIDATQKYYGIVARHVTGATAYIDSAYCGRAIRFAFFDAARR